MDLWIFSQDGDQLLKVDNLLATARMNKNGEWLIMYHNSVLGAYLTKKRALEVLKDIKNCLCNHSYSTKTNGLGEIIELIPNPLFVYNMPEK